MKIKQLNSFGELTPDRLARFEREHILRLPEDYRQFLLEYNGGIPGPEDTIDFEGGSSDLQCLYGISDGDNVASLERNLEDIKEWGIDEGLPIGHDFFGNFFLLSVQSGREGQVFFWDHDLGDMLLVAASFTEFTEKLYERKYSDDFQVSDKHKVPNEPEIHDEFKLPPGLEFVDELEGDGWHERPDEFEPPDDFEVLDVNESPQGFESSRVFEILDELDDSEDFEEPDEFGNISKFEEPGES